MIAGAVFLLLVQLLYSPIGFNGSMWITAAIAAGLFLVPVIGLILDGAPFGHYPYVFLGPIYALWRNWINLSALIRRRQIRWIRTERSEEA
jgi:hypothetical protein